MDGYQSTSESMLHQYQMGNEYLYDSLDNHNPLRWSFSLTDDLNHNLASDYLQHASASSLDEASSAFILSKSYSMPIWTTGTTNIDLQPKFPYGSFQDNMDFTIRKPLYQIEAVESITPDLKPDPLVSPWQSGSSVESIANTTSKNTIQGQKTIAKAPTPKASPPALPCSNNNSNKNNNNKHATKRRRARIEQEKERHKNVESKYRTQIKTRFQDLLHALPAHPPDDERVCERRERRGKMTRGRVLDLAKGYIDELDRTKRALEDERDVLRWRIGMYEALLCR